MDHFERTLFAFIMTSLSNGLLDLALAHSICPLELTDLHLTSHFTTHCLDLALIQYLDLTYMAILN